MVSMLKSIVDTLSIVDSINDMMYHWKALESALFIINFGAFLLDLMRLLVVFRKLNYEEDKFWRRKEPNEPKLDEKSKKKWKNPNTG